MFHVSVTFFYNVLNTHSFNWDHSSLESSSLRPECRNLKSSDSSSSNWNKVVSLGRASPRDANEIEKMCSSCFQCCYNAAFISFYPSRSAKEISIPLRCSIFFVVDLKTLADETVPRCSIPFFFIDLQLAESFSRKGERIKPCNTCRWLYLNRIFGTCLNKQRCYWRMWWILQTSTCIIQPIFMASLLFSLIASSFFFYFQLQTVSLCPERLTEIG